MLIKHEDLLQQVSKKKNIPYEQVRILFNDLFQQIMMHLQHPEDNFLRGIIIENSIKITLNPKQVCKAFGSMVRNDLRPDSFYVQNLIKLNQQLLDYGIYTEKQKETVQNYERDRIQKARGEEHHTDEEE